MTRLLKYSVLALALVLGTSTYAHAECVTVADGGLGGLITQIWDSLFNPSSGNSQHNTPPQNNKPSKNKNTAPEIDPSLAMSGFMLLGGTLTVLSTRRPRRQAIN
jgi:hypothetical protein